MALIPINQENITSSFRFSIGSKLERIQVFWLGKFWEELVEHLHMLNQFFPEFSPAGLIFKLEYISN